MRFTTAVILGLATLLPFAAAKDAAHGQKKHNLRVKKVQMKNTGGNAKLAEDEGYWERFLQGEQESIPTPPPPTPPPPTPPPPTPPPPTPPPPGTCDVEVEMTCMIEMDGDMVECKDMTSDPEDCGPTTVEYCYTIDNKGDECGTVSLVERTRTPPGAPDGTKDLTDLVPGGELCPGNSIEVCETETIDTCDDQCYETSVKVELTMPDDKTCNDDAMYKFCIEPGCKVEIETECTVDGTDTPCDEIPSTPDECGPTDIEYCYTISNVGESCGTINKLERTRTPPGDPEGTTDLTDLVPDGELCPGETVTVCETESVDTCVEQCYETSVSVDVDMPDGFQCSADDEYEFCIQPGCDVSVNAVCKVDGTETDCTDISTTPDDCGPTDVEYCYSIDNVGTTCGTITTLERTRTPPGAPDGTKDLIDLVAEEDRELCEGETVVVCETETIDTCEEQCYETTVKVELDMPDGETCVDEDEYEFCVNPGCKVEVEIDCKLEGTETDCSDIPPAGPTDCEDTEQPISLEYCYDVANTGTTCGDITTLERTRTPPGDPDGTVDLIGKLEGNANLCPGDSVQVCETVEVDSCIEGCYETVVNVEITMPDETTCNDEDLYEVCVPPPSTESCNVEVEVDCSTADNNTEDGSGECDVLIPIATRCDKRATEMTWRFNGGNCDQSFNIQEADKFSCTDFGEGAPTEGSAYLVVTSAKSTDDVYFQGDVLVGDLFTMYASDTDKGKFDADSIFSVYADSSMGDPLQVSNVHTSCSQNLFLKDKFGSVQLLIFENEFGLFTCFINATYSYTLTNEGAADSGKIVEFTSTTNGVSEDCMDNIGDDDTVEPGTTVIVDKEVLIDMTVRQEYNTEAFIKAETPGGATCTDTATLSFEAGNPNVGDLF